MPYNTLEQLKAMTPDQLMARKKELEAEITQGGDNSYGGLTMPKPTPANIALAGLAGALRGNAGQPPAAPTAISPLEHMYMQNMLTQQREKNMADYKAEKASEQPHDIVYRKSDTGESVDPETAKADIAAGNKENYNLFLKQGGKETPLTNIGQSRIDVAKIRTWQGIVDKANPKNASQGTSLGMAAVNDQRADRALDLLNKSGKLTPQELNIITTDLAAIVRGGVPTDIGSREAEYGNISSKAAGWLEKINSGTVDVGSPEVRNQLRQDMLGMKNLSRGIINDNFDYIESLQSGFIKSHKQDWDNMRARYREGAVSGKQNEQPGQGAAIRSGKTKSGLSYTVEG